MKYICLLVPVLFAELKTALCYCSLATSSVLIQLTCAIEHFFNVHFYHVAALVSQSLFSVSILLQNMF